MYLLEPKIQLSTIDLTLFKNVFCIETNINIGFYIQYMFEKNNSNSGARCQSETINFIFGISDVSISHLG